MAASTGRTRKYFHGFSSELVSDLKRIIQSEQPEDIALLDFELHLSNTFDIVGFPMDVGAGQLDNIDLLQERDRDLPTDFTEVELDNLFSVFAVWFTECWKKAGGAKFSYPAYLCQHDSNNSFDLKNEKWIENSEKWDD